MNILIQRISLSLAAVICTALSLALHADLVEARQANQRLSAFLIAILPSSFRASLYGRAIKYQATYTKDSTCRIRVSTWFEGGSYRFVNGVPVPLASAPPPERRLIYLVQGRPRSGFWHAEGSAHNLLPSANYVLWDLGDIDARSISVTRAYNNDERLLNVTSLSFSFPFHSIEEANLVRKALLETTKTCSGG